MNSISDAPDAWNSAEDFVPGRDDELPSKHSSPEQCSLVNARAAASCLLGYLLSNGIRRNDALTYFRLKNHERRRGETADRRNAERQSADDGSC